MVCSRYEIYYEVGISKTRCFKLDPFPVPVTDVIQSGHNVESQLVMFQFTGKLKQNVLDASEF